MRKCHAPTGSRRRLSDWLIDDSGNASSRALSFGDLGAPAQLFEIFLVEFLALLVFIAGLGLKH